MDHNVGQCCQGVGYPMRDKMMAEVQPLREDMEKMLRSRVTLAIRPTPLRPLIDPNL